MKIAILFLAIILIWRFRNRIIFRARKYIGEQEVSSGPIEYGFQNPKFEKKMIENGFRPTYDWCAIFGKAVITDSLLGKKKKIINQLMTPSTQQTYRNLLDASQKYPWIKLSQTPKLNAIAIWQHTSNPAYGHMGIVDKIASNGRFRTIEGNTPTPTHFDGVTARWHSISEKNNNLGLRLHKYFIKIS